MFSIIINTIEIEQKNHRNKFCSFYYSKNYKKHLSVDIVLFVQILNHSHLSRIFAEAWKA